MEMLKKCFNPKVIWGLALIGIGIWIVSPGLIKLALPLLILAICPLSMLGMMAMIGKDKGDDQPDSPRTATKGDKS